VAVDGQQAHKLLKLAFELGFTGIGVNQKTSGRFIHLDTLTEAPRPNVWSY
jgi:zinc D-Ala-D-Ala carboxypeptidase